MRIKMRERKRGMAEKKREKSVDVLDRLFWTVQPPMGLVKGDYYRAENWFAPHFPGDKGYHGILEVVRRDGTLQMVEFNEINNPTYYIRRYQGVSKRLSDYRQVRRGAGKRPDPSGRADGGGEPPHRRV